MRRTAPQYRIFKTLRFDENSFVPVFFKALLNTAQFRPYLRPDSRLPFTTRLENGKYVVKKTVEVSDHLVSEYELQFTRPQSASYCDPASNYKPPYFGHNSARRDLVVGMSFDEKDCFIRRIMMYDGGTCGRPYDHSTYEEAERYLKRQIDSGFYHDSLESLREAGLLAPQERINEVMAGFKWNLDGSSHITVFSNNLESRLLGQLFAAELKRSLKEKYPDEEKLVTPISIYPDFRFYSLYDQEQDRNVARDKKQFLEYVDAISLLTGKEFSYSQGCFSSSSFCLLSKVSSQLSYQIVNAAQSQLDVLIENGDQLESLISLKSNTESQRTQILTFLQKKLWELIGSDDRLRRLLSLDDITEEQKKQIFTSIRNRLIMLIESGSQSKQSLSQRGITTFQIMKCIESYSQLEQLLSLNSITEAQRTEILTAVQEKYPHLIQDVDQVERLLSLNGITQTQRTLIWSLVKDQLYLQLLIRNGNQLKHLLSLSCITQEERGYIFDMVYDHHPILESPLVDLIQDGSEFVDLFSLTFITETQRTQMLNALQEKLGFLIENRDQLRRLLSVSGITQAQRTLILAAANPDYLKEIEAADNADGSIKYAKSESSQFSSSMLNRKGCTPCFWATRNKGVGMPGCALLPYFANIKP